MLSSEEYNDYLFNTNQVGSIFWAWIPCEANFLEQKGDAFDSSESHIVDVVQLENDTCDEVMVVSEEETLNEKLISFDLDRKSVV